MISPGPSSILSSMPTRPQHISSSCCSTQQRRIIFPNLHSGVALLTTSASAAMSTVTPAPRNSGVALEDPKKVSSCSNYSLRSAVEHLVILSPFKNNTSTAVQVGDDLEIVPPPYFSTAATPMMKRSIHASVVGRSLVQSTQLKGKLEKPSSRRTIIISRQLSDVPSLTSLSSTDSMNSTSTTSAEEPVSTATSHSRRVGVSFDPRVWVRVFERSAGERDVTWYQQDELDAFKCDAMRCIQQYEHGKMPTKCSFSHQALQPTSSGERRVTVDSILIVDPHDLVLSLLTKSFRLLWPDVSIDTVQTSAAALELVVNAPHNKQYDVIAVEERLSLFHRHPQGDRQQQRSVGGCGSLLLEQLHTQSPSSLLIGMSAHLDVDQSRLAAAHADVVWGKPPPAMTERLRQELEDKLQCKRKGSTTIESLP